MLTTGGLFFFSISPLDRSTFFSQDSSALNASDDGVAAAGNPADGRASRRPPVGFVVSLCLLSVCKRGREGDDERERQTQPSERGIIIRAVAKSREEASACRCSPPLPHPLPLETKNPSFVLSGS